MVTIGDLLKTSLLTLDINNPHYMLSMKERDEEISFIPKAVIIMFPYSGYEIAIWQGRVADD